VVTVRAGVCAVGLVGLRVAHAEVTVGGYVETYYQLNVRTPSNRITNFRGFDNRDRTFTIENAALDVRAERGPLTARVILQIGVLAIKDNWNWSRSDLFFGLPFYHTGARVSVPLGGGWVGTLHAYAGWNSVVDNNRYPSVAAAAADTGAKVSGQLLYFGGVERPTGAPEGTPWRNLLDAYATLTVTGALSVIGHLDGGFERNKLGTSGWIAGALYAKYAVTSTLYAAVRGDYFRERVARDDGTSPAAVLAERVDRIGDRDARLPTDRGALGAARVPSRSRAGRYVLRRRRRG
jgi:hypothetical protein